jgi:hypothetical protein
MSVRVDEFTMKRVSAQSPLASATALSIPNDGDSAVVSGTTTIASMLTHDRRPGSRFYLTFSGICQLTNSATLNVGGSNLSTVAGSTYEFQVQAVNSVALLVFSDSSIAGALQKASNLSDLASASTGRTNLGVAYGTTSGTVAQGNDARFGQALAGAQAPAIVVGANVDGVIAVTVTLKSPTGAALTASKAVKYWVSDVAGGAPSSVGPSGGLAVTTGIAIDVVVIGIGGVALTTSLGVLVLTLTQATAGNYYVNVLYADGFVASSAVCAF